ncbi:MAG: OmpA family protein [Gammaproteobacteria bacterium]|nr:OmpA family protein [Gammaproteobacteria bacterium]
MKLVPALTAVVVLVSGCSMFRDDPALDLEQDLVPVPSETASLNAPMDGGFITTDGTVVSGYQDSQVFQSGGVDDSNLRERVIYFDSDADTVRTEFMSVVASHGRQLASNPSLRLRVEGHTDERGSSSYNIALGERRALAVRRLLMVEGAQANQVIVTSLGEEMPVATGHSEGAWAQNRRAELVYE